MSAKNAILKAKIEGAIYEVLVKTTAAHVMVDDNTTLAAKLATMISDIATKATKQELTDGLATKAAAEHKHEESDINGLSDKLATLATTKAMEDAVAALKQEMLGDTPVEAYNTFTELAAYIAEHKDISDALTEAVGNKADKTALEAVQNAVNALGTLAQLDIVSEDNLSADLKAKINASAEGNHSHDNKEVLDGITSEKVAGWDDAAAKKHVHENQAVLDGISSAKVTAWDKKANIYYSATEPANLSDGDLWFQLVE